MQTILWMIDTIIKYYDDDDDDDDGGDDDDDDDQEAQLDKTMSNY